MPFPTFFRKFRIGVVLLPLRNESQRNWILFPMMLLNSDEYHTTMIEKERERERERERIPYYVSCHIRVRE